MQGLDDQCSHTLYHILNCAWLLQADSILLECVANVTQFINTQDTLTRYADHASMHCHRLVFDLQCQWTMR
jgi:hypothetical protein